MEVSPSVARNVFPVFPLILGGKVALNRLRPLPRFNATFPPNIKGKTLLVAYTCVEALEKK